MAVSAQKMTTRMCPWNVPEPFSPSYTLETRKILIDGLPHRRICPLLSYPKFMSLIPCIGWSTFWNPTSKFIYTSLMWCLPTSWRAESDPYSRDGLASKTRYNPTGQPCSLEKKKTRLIIVPRIMSPNHSIHLEIQKILIDGSTTSTWMGLPFVPMHSCIPKTCRDSLMKPLPLCSPVSLSVCTRCGVCSPVDEQNLIRTPKTVSSSASKIHR